MSALGRRHARHRDRRHRDSRTAALFYGPRVVPAAPVSAPATIPLVATSERTDATQPVDRVSRRNQWSVAASDESATTGGNYRNAEADNSTANDRTLEFDPVHEFCQVFEPQAHHATQRQWESVAGLMFWRLSLCRRLAPLRDALQVELQRLKGDSTLLASAIPLIAAGMTPTNPLSQVLAIIDGLMAGDRYGGFLRQVACVWRQTALQLQVVYIVGHVANDSKEFFTEHVLPRWLQAKYGAIANVPTMLRPFYDGCSGRVQLVLWDADLVIWRPHEGAWRRPESLADVVLDYMRSMFETAVLTAKIPAELALYSDALLAPPERITMLSRLGLNVLNEMTLLHQKLWRCALNFVLEEPVVHAIRSCECEWSRDVDLALLLDRPPPSASSTSSTSTSALSTTASAATSSTATTNRKRKERQG